MVGSRGSMLGTDDVRAAPAPRFEPANTWDDMQLEVTKTGVIALALTLLVVVGGGLYLNWRATSPASVDRSLDEAVESFESRRWERPPLETRGGEVASTNAFESLRPALEKIRRDDLSPFRLDGSGERELRERKVSDETRTFLEQTSVRQHVETLRRSSRTSWSWAGIELASYVNAGAVDSKHDGLKDATRTILRTARMLAADALRQGGEACLKGAAELARFAQDVSAGAPLLRSATRGATLGMLQYVVPPCAAEASPDALARAREWFHTLVSHPVPTSRSLEAEVLSMALQVRALVHGTRPVPTGWDEFGHMVEAPRLFGWIEEALAHRDVLHRIPVALSPEAAEHVEAYRRAIDTPRGGPVLLKRGIVRDQQSQNNLRLALVTIAHYERISTRSPTAEAGRRIGEGFVRARHRARNPRRDHDDTSDADEPETSLLAGPPDIVGRALVRDAVSGEPMTWRTLDASTDGAFEVCYLRPERLRARGKSERYCWTLPPASG